MSRSAEKKQNFMHGAAILTVGVIIMKILGAIYKVPLGNILGDYGYGIFLSTYNVYNIFFTLSTAGLPVALSRMIAVADVLKPDSAEAIHPNNVKKVIRAIERLEAGEGRVRPFDGNISENPDYDPLMVCLTRDREELYDRINRRVDALVEAGLIDEVKKLTGMGLTAEDISMKGIGYKEIIEYLDGETSLEEAVDKIKKNTRHYAKRQLTWFRRYDRIHLFDLSAYLTDQEAKRGFISWLEKKL